MLINSYGFQVSRSIGDAYLKKAEFNREPLLAKFRLSEPFSTQILNPEPSIFIHKINPKDKFLIFASDGLWEHLSNEEAVDIVHNYPRSVSLSSFCFIIIIPFSPKLQSSNNLESKRKKVNYVVFGIAF